MSSQTSSGTANGQGGGQGSMWDAVSKAVDQYVHAFDKQMKRWQTAGDKLGRGQYGPANAAKDVQEMYVDGMKAGFKLAQLGWSAWMAGATDMGSWSRPGEHGTGPGPPPCAKTQAEVEIEARYQECRNAFLAGDAVKTASFYAENLVYEAEFLPALKEALKVGANEDQKKQIDALTQRQALAALMGVWFARKGDFEQFDAEYNKKHCEVAASGDMAWEWGTMRVHYKGMPEWMGTKEKPWLCRYMVVWQKVNGVWLMTFDMTNSQVWTLMRVEQAATPKKKATQKKTATGQTKAARKK